MNYTDNFVYDAMKTPSAGLAYCAYICLLYCVLGISVHATIHIALEMAVTLGQRKKKRQRNKFLKNWTSSWMEVCVSLWDISPIQLSSSAYGMNSNLPQLYL